MTTNKTKSKSPPNKKVCDNCNKSKAQGEFYNGDKMFFPSGKLNTCKECCLKIVEENGHDGLLGLLRMINKPFYQDLFKDDVGDYIRMMNSMPQYKNVGFVDSDSLIQLTDISKIKRAKPTELSEEDLRDSEDFWGVGLQEQEYIWLNLEYGDYLNRYEVDSKTLENLIREICLVQLDIRNARSQKKDVKNELKAYNDLLTAANLKPSQSTGNMSVDQETYGTLIKKLETERPVSDPSPEWQDVDKVGLLIRTFFLAPLAKMFGKENKFQDEYEEEISKYTVKPRKEDD